MMRKRYTAVRTHKDISAARTAHKAVISASVEEKHGLFSVIQILRQSINESRAEKREVAVLCFGAHIDYIGVGNTAASVSARKLA